MLTVEGTILLLSAQSSSFTLHTYLDSCVNQFVKLVSATPSQVLSLITEPERHALESQLTELTREEASEQCFIQSALQDLKVQSARLFKGFQGLIRPYPSQAREVELMQKKDVQLEVEKLLTGKFKS